jgi:hypothetical protein
VSTWVHEFVQDVMQVCRNGHVVTDRMQTCPETSRHHCEQCGATTLHACPTCGKPMPGAVVVPGLHPVGTCTAPWYCASCGAAFPWRKKSADSRTGPAASILEGFLRRLPATIRELRSRFGTRPAFRIEDEHDLEDLGRSLLPLVCNGVRLRSRVPGYAAGARTDFLIQPDGIVLALKKTALGMRLAQLDHQRQEDLAHYRAVPECRALWIYILDLQGYLPAPRRLELVWSNSDEEPVSRCIIAPS